MAKDLGHAQYLLQFLQASPCPGNCLACWVAASLGAAHHSIPIMSHLCFKKAVTRPGLLDTNDSFSLLASGSHAKYVNYLVAPVHRYLMGRTRNLQLSLKTLVVLTRDTGTEVFFDPGTSPGRNGRSKKSP